MKAFTGYINLYGEHIEDGIKNPVTTFTENEQSITLRWLEKQYDMFYEIERTFSKKHILAGRRLDPQKDGRGAGEALFKWHKETIGRNERNS